VGLGSVPCCLREGGRDEVRKSETPSAPTKVPFCAFTTTRGSFAPTRFVFAAALLPATQQRAATGWRS